MFILFVLFGTSFGTTDSRTLMDAKGGNQAGGRDGSQAAVAGNGGGEAEFPAVLDGLLRRTATRLDVTQAVGFVAEPADARLLLRECIHLGLPDDPALRAAALSGLRKMAQRCVDTGKPRAAFGIGCAPAGAGMKFCLVHVLRDGTGPRAAVAVITRCADREDVRSQLGILCGEE